MVPWRHLIPTAIAAAAAAGCAPSNGVGEGPGPAVIRGPGGTVKVCQITGETDTQTGAPRWSEDESEATDLFDEPCVDEQSVQYAAPRCTSR